MANDENLCKYRISKMTKKKQFKPTSLLFRLNIVFVRVFIKRKRWKNDKIKSKSQTRKFSTTKTTIFEIEKEFSIPRE